MKTLTSEKAHMKQCNVQWIIRTSFLFLQKFSTSEWVIGTSRVEDILLWKKPGIFRFVTLPLELLGITMFHYWKFRKIVLNPLEINQGQKIKTPGNSTFIFLITPANFKFFLINIWSFHMLLPQYLRKFHVFKPPLIVTLGKIWKYTSFFWYVFSCICPWILSIYWKIWFRENLYICMSYSVCNWVYRYYILFRCTCKILCMKRKTCCTV